MPKTVSTAVIALLAIAFVSRAAVVAQERAKPPGHDMPDPDGRGADLRKKVQVFVMLGQSNMLGFGKVAPADKEGSLERAVRSEQLYPFLVDDEGRWTERKDVRNVRVMVGRGACGRPGCCARSGRDAGRPGARADR